MPTNNQYSSAVQEDEITNEIMHAVRQVSNSALVDTNKYVLAIRTLEIVLVKQLREDPTYKQAVEKKREELKKVYTGKMDGEKLKRELADFRFEELMIRVDDLVERQVNLKM